MKKNCQTDRDKRPSEGILERSTLIPLLLLLVSIVICATNYDDFALTICNSFPEGWEFEACENVQYSIPDFGRISRFGADVFEQVNMTGANSNNRARLAVDVAAAYRTFTDLKVKVKYSALSNREILANALQSYSKNAKRVAELLMDTDLQSKSTLESFISHIEFIASILEEAKGKKNMGKAVKLLWKEFAHGIEKQINQLNLVMDLAVESQTRLQELDRELEKIHELIAYANKINNFKIQEKEGHDPIEQLWVSLGLPKNELSENVRLINELQKERKLAATRVDETLRLLKKFITYLEGVHEPAYTVVVNTDKNAESYVRLVNDLQIATASMVKVKKSIDAEPVKVI